MKFRTFALVFLFIFGLYGHTKAQFHNTGQDRASIHWKQINTPDFRLVFPDYAEAKAKVFAQKLHWASQNVSADMDHKTTKIEVIMFMESSTSNAMVVWAPKRMEIHAQMPQDGYAQDWLEQLALHEYRHVVQIDKLNTGLTKIISYVFGEMGTSVVLGAYLPLWYLEGDAVAIETAESETGRGRMANFAMPLKAQLLQNGAFSYDKATNGSYKDFVPDHYILGYHLVSLGSSNFGNDIWKNTEQFVARNPYYIVPFSHAIRKQSGLRKNQFYQHCMQQLDSIWQPLPLRIYFDTLWRNSTKDFTNYQAGQLLNDSILVVLKSGLDDISQFRTINLYTKKEKLLFTPGYSSFYNITIQDSLIFWTERRYHPRWEKVKYQVLMSYDFRTREKKQLSRKSNYYFPVMDSESKRIACINQSSDGNNSIVILNSTDGLLEQEIHFDKQIKNLSFGPTSNILYFFRLQSNGYELVEYNRENKGEKILLPANFNNRGTLLLKGNYLYFYDDMTGASNIFCLDLASQKQYQVSDVPFGAQNLNRYKNSILFSSYSADGWQVNSITENPENWIPLEKVSKNKDDFFINYVSDSQRNIQRTDTFKSNFEIKNYSKIGHLVNIHSWGPISIDVDNTTLNPGVSILSQNLLSSMEIGAGYEYLLDEANGRYYANISYMGWYPIVSLELSSQNRDSYYRNSVDQKIPYSYKYNSIELNIKQGINLNKGRFFNYIQAELGLINTFLTAGENAPNFFPDGNYFTSTSYRIYASSFQIYGLRDLKPRWGQTIDIQYNSTPFETLNKSTILGVQSRLYFPAIGKHHSLNIYMAYQQSISGQLIYSNVIRTPRGYSNIRGNELYSLQANYELPLFYPDFSLGSLVYFKRLRTNIFTDFTQSYVSTTTNYNSVGIDLLTDVHLLRFFSPVALGLRSAYLDNNSFYFQLLLSVSL